MYPVAMAGAPAQGISGLGADNCSGAGVALRRVTAIPAYRCFPMRQTKVEVTLATAHSRRNVRPLHPARPNPPGTLHSSSSERRFAAVELRAYTVRTRAVGLHRGSGAAGFLNLAHPQVRRLLLTRRVEFRPATSSLPRLVRPRPEFPLRRSHGSRRRSARLFPQDPLPHEILATMAPGQPAPGVRPIPSRAPPFGIAGSESAAMCYRFLRYAE